MLEKGFLKPKISTEKIGKRQFWIGLIIGVFFAFIINHFFIVSREVLRSLTFIRDPFILSNKDFKLYDLFFAAFSTSLGFGITIICWLYTPNRKIKKGYLKTYSVATSFFVTWLALATVSRFGSIIPFILYSSAGYDNHLDFLNDFWIILLLIPIYVFFANWNAVRLLFKTNNWILISMLIFLLNTVFLFKTTYFDRDILNQTHYSKNEDRYKYIDNEFDFARKYGIVFTDSTKNILQKKYADRTTDLVNQVKNAFNRNELVPMDTLILAKIIIHNRNQMANPWHREIDSTEQNWSYALPEQIYYQIVKHEVDSPETQILFEILYEQISIFTVKDIDRKNREEYTRDEFKKYLFKKHMLRNTSTIQSRLIQVIGKLHSDNKYKKYHHLIPEFEFVETKNQIHYKMKL